MACFGDCQERSRIKDENDSDSLKGLRICYFMLLYYVTLLCGLFWAEDTQDLTDSRKTFTSPLPT